MSSLQEAYLKAFDPKIAIKVVHLEGKKVPNETIDTIHLALRRIYKVSIDRENSTIYIGKDS